MDQPNMGPSTCLSKLPVEILEMIFGYLVGNKFKSDLLNATLVCKQWHQIISHSTSLMDQLNLILFYEEITSQKFELVTSRQHRRIIIHKKSFSSYSSHENLRAIQFINRLATLFKDCLTTLFLHGISISQEQIKYLSFCKRLRTLELRSVGWLDEAENENQISQKQPFQLRNLMVLRIFNCPPQNSILNFIDCKQLDIFEVSSDFRRGHSFGSSSVINFMNQLIRCDEIHLNIQNWHFDIQMNPKFLWRKLKLTCLMVESTLTDVTIPSIEALCRASQLNAESKIRIEEYRETGCIRTNLRDGTHQLWIPILNNCRNITSLQLVCEKVPLSVLTRLRNLSDVRKLKIHGDLLGASFAYLTKKLTNVKDLEIQMTTRYMGGYGRVGLSDEIELMLKPFMNQITSLQIPDRLYEQIPNVQKCKSSRLFDNEFGNLQTVTIRLVQDKPTSGNLGALLNSLSPQSRDLDLILQAERNINCIEYRLLDCFNAPFKTCNIMVPERMPENRKSSFHSMKYKNWRETGMNELELFGKLLTERENHFFV